MLWQQLLTYNFWKILLIVLFDIFLLHFLSFKTTNWNWFLIRHGISLAYIPKHQWWHGSLYLGFVFVWVHRAPSVCFVLVFFQRAPSVTFVFVLIFIHRAPSVTFFLYWMTKKSSKVVIVVEVIKFYIFLLDWERYILSYKHLFIYTSCLDDRITKKEVWWQCTIPNYFTILQLAVLFFNDCWNSKLSVK